MSLDKLLAAKLAELEAADLRRFLPGPVDEAQALLNFASNDYLGLSVHPAVVAAACEATARLGSGARAARLLAGNDAPKMMELERALAHWKEKEAALVFGSGYAAALGTIPALVGKGDTVILDKLAHASLIDAARLSGATVRTFRHNSCERLETLLQSLGTSRGRRLIVTESLFSMDGDVAPLREIVEIKDQHDAWLLVDEAHATGLYGPAGAGLISELGLSARVEIILATMGKALGGVGGVIAGSRLLIDWMVNRARSFVFSTALPPAAIAASLAAVRVVQSPEGEKLRDRLRSNVAYFRAGLGNHWREHAPATGAIQPLLCGEAAEALRISRALRNHGLFVPAIRYPTVPRHQARLRLTLSAAHRESEIDRLLIALNKHR